MKSLARILVILLYVSAATALPGFARTASFPAEFIASSVNGKLIFGSQLLAPPPEIPAVPLPQVLTSYQNRGELIQVLLRRALILSELERTNQQRPTAQQIDAVYTSWMLELDRSGAARPQDINPCMSDDDVRWYIQEALALSTFIETRYSPFVRVTFQDIAEFAEANNISWERLSPVMIEAVVEAAEERILAQKVNERLSGWLEERLAEATIE